MKFYKELEFKKEGIAIRTFDQYDVLFNKISYSNKEIEDMKNKNKTITI